MLANPDDSIQYTDVNISFRAPRVAIVIRADQNWIFWARHAIYTASQMWGGYGFILVPHRDGVVNPILMRSVKAYDPDYVVNIPITVKELDFLYPGHLNAQLEKLQNNGLAPEDLKSVRISLSQTVVPVASDDLQARESVVNACAPYRLALGDDSDVSKWAERITILRAEKYGLDEAPFFRIDRITPTSRPRFGAASNENTPIGLLAANYSGLVRPPQIGEADIDESHEFALILGIAEPAARRRILPSWSCFEEVNSVDGEEPVSAWDDTQIELGPVSDGENQPVLYVIGNTAEDFCLALVWERLYGQALWIPDELWVDSASNLAAGHRQALVQGMINRTDIYTSEQCLLTSVSSEVQTVDDFRNAMFNTEPLTVVLSSADNQPVEDANKPREDQVNVIQADSIRFPGEGRISLGIARQFYRNDTMPIIRDAEGGVTLAGTPPPPILDAPGLQRARVPFHIDLDIPAVTMPQGRALPPAALVHTSDRYFGRYEVLVRNGRRGVSYESFRHGIIRTGTPPEEELSRPRVRKPAMLTWARWKAQMCGYELHVSDAGWPAHILGEMSGSRLALTNAFSGQLRPSLLMFKTQPSGTATDDIFNNKLGQQGCVINRIPYLTLRGFERFSALPLEDVRVLVDELLSSGLLARGLILRCNICRVFSFYAVDQVAQSNECPRCRNSNRFTQSAWNYPAGEPDWFYHLHPLGRDLIRDNGDVPLLLSNYLQKQVGERFSDTPEVVVLKGRKTVAEADIVAVAGDLLIVGEVKSNDALAGKKDMAKAVRARLHLAEIFGADEIVIATTEASWSGPSLDAIESEVAAHVWPSGLRPKLRSITSLSAHGQGVETYL
jgi:hypothetical protein